MVDESTGDWDEFCESYPVDHDTSKAQRLANGLNIFVKHGGENTDAQHDVLYVEGPDPSSLSQSERETLATNGWNWNEEEGWYYFT
ncbi:MAG TPA: hypothetical protein VMX17_10380 [Candidatus Glassbacteria bacterium]|nr:hypothetical protein [Candidatus Glassbacteria bacterium]